MTLTASRHPRLARRRGTALIVVMLMLLMLTGMTILILNGAQTSQMQARDQIALSRASLAADVALSHGFMAIRKASPLPTTTDDVIVTDRAFGGGNVKGDFEGQFDYRLALESTTTTTPAPGTTVVSTVYRIDAEGRVRTGMATDGASQWTRSGMQQWIEEAVTTTNTDEVPPPPADADAAAITVASKGDLPNFEITRNGNHAQVSGNNHGLNGAAIANGGGFAALLSSGGPSTFTGDVPAALEADDVDGDDDPYRTDVPYSALDPWLASLRATSASATTTYDGSGAYSLESQGSETAPVLVKVELTGDGTVELKGDKDFYGVLIIKVKGDWSGNKPAFLISGTPNIKGIIYIEVETLGQKNKASTELLSLDGGGGDSNQLGAIFVDVTEAAATTYKNAGGTTKKLAHMGGGGDPSTRKYAFSRAGVALGSLLLEPTESGTATETTTVYSILANRVTGAQNIEAP